MLSLKQNSKILQCNHWCPHKIKRNKHRNCYYPNLGYTSGHTCSNFGLHYPLDKSISNRESIYLDHPVDRDLLVDNSVIYLLNHWGPQPIRTTWQICEVTGHQCEISALKVPRMTFCQETGGGIEKCWLFSLLSLRLQVAG